MPLPRWRLQYLTHLRFRFPLPYPARAAILPAVPTYGMPSVEPMAPALDSALLRFSHLLALLPKLRIALQNEPPRCLRRLLTTLRPRDAGRRPPFLLLATYLGIRLYIIAKSTFAKNT